MNGIAPVCARFGVNEAESGEAALEPRPEFGHITVREWERVRSS
jgi:hypothetical protein